MNRIINIIVVVIIVAIVIAIGVGTSIYAKNNIPSAKSDIDFNIDMSKWKYDKENNVFYQIGVKYCENSSKSENETMSIYVPGEYFKDTKNDDETYTCVLNESGEKSGHKASETPVIIPIDTNINISQKPHKEYNYSSISAYMDLGYICIWAGTQGMDTDKTNYSIEEYNSAVIDAITDLKAVVTYYRFNGDVLPGDTEKIISFGINEGGTKSAVFGASGDSDLYYSRLVSIGAVTENKEGKSISNSVNGTMCYGPVMNMELEDSSLAWNVGQYIDKTDDEEPSETENRATEFAEYINDMKLKSEDGTLLYLNETKDGIYTKGTFYNYILNDVEKALNDFLHNTKFPYTNKNSITYGSALDYINFLNKDGEWIYYDENINNAKIKSLKDFALNCKNTTKEGFNLTSSNAYNPLYYLSSKYKGYGSSYISRYWNICIEVDNDYKDFSSEEILKIVLEKNEDVRKIKYNILWGKEYSNEEKTKMAVQELKLWIESCGITSNDKIK